MSQAPEFTLDQLTGRSREHLAELENGPGSRCALHKAVVAPYLAMRAAAAIDGIDLVAFSGFRDFDRQLGIWNGKYRGERPMQDRAGRAVDVSALTPAERVTAILWWSALPGASRHHWGTDFDVMDAAALPPGYKLQVIPAEYQPGGPFARLTAWLDTHMHAFGFFRPYTTDRGGVAPEPWHLSYAPVAARAQAALKLDGLRAVLSAAAIDGKEEVLAALARNFASYVVNVDEAPERASMSPRLA
ncbi:MAG TPA: M15 family metallopeptidase [Steroidobacteraceae bacterium]|nr:M15 family metallopeptidase [Steroidobacteraceae bacterium]